MGSRGHLVFARRPPPLRPPASPAGVEDRRPDERQAGTQHLFSPRHLSPTCAAPTWASVARGRTPARSQQPAASPQRGAPQLSSPRYPSPSHIAPTWASDARGGFPARPQQPAASPATPADVHHTIQAMCHLGAPSLLYCAKLRRLQRGESLLPLPSAYQNTVSVPASSRCWRYGRNRLKGTV
jgi:hypothetical protein